MSLAAVALFKWVRTHVDLSSAALRFAAERPLATGLCMEIVVAWPTLLEGRIPLQLIASGLVVRTQGTDTVVTIERYGVQNASRNNVRTIS